VSFVRARQPAITRLFPHQGNQRFIVPNLRRVAPAPNLVEDSAFATGCGDGIWECQGSVIITAGVEAQLGPSFGGAERLHQDAAWVDDNTDYLVSFDVLTMTPGPVPIEIHMGQVTSVLVLQDADVGTTVSQVVAVGFPGVPEEFGLELNEDGHTIALTNLEARVAP
jgi:hypothetical protein